MKRIWVFVAILGFSGLILIQITEAAPYKSVFTCIEDPLFSSCLIRAGASIFCLIDGSNCALGGGGGGGESLFFTEGPAIKINHSATAAIGIDLNDSESFLKASHGNFSDNLTVNNLTTTYLFLDTARSLWIVQNPGTIFNSLTSEGLWIHDDHTHVGGEIHFLISHQNETNLWLQTGRNNSFSAIGNSFGIIPNYMGIENFSTDGVVNMSQISNYEFLCTFFNRTCLFAADTRGRARGNLPGGPLGWIMGDWEVWGAGHLMEGADIDDVFTFHGVGGHNFDVFNSSIHITEQRVDEVGFDAGANVTLLNVDFNGGGIDTFIQQTSGGGAEEWVVPIETTNCNDIRCARAIGAGGEPLRIMETNISTINFTMNNLSFYLTTIGLTSSSVFNVSMENEEGTIVNMFSITDGTDATNNFTILHIPTSMSNKSEVMLKFTLEAASNKQAFVDDVKMNGTADFSTLANVTVLDGDLVLGSEICNIKLNGSGTETLTIGGPTCGKVIIQGNETVFVNIEVQDQNVTGNIIPGVNNSFNIGSVAAWWGEIFTSILTAENIVASLITSTIFKSDSYQNSTGSIKWIGIEHIKDNLFCLINGCTYTGNVDFIDANLTINDSGSYLKMGINYDNDGEEDIFLGNKIQFLGPPSGVDIAASIFFNKKTTIVPALIINSSTGDGAATSQIHLIPHGTSSASIVKIIGGGLHVDESTTLFGETQFRDETQILDNTCHGWGTGAQSRPDVCMEHNSTDMLFYLIAGAAKQFGSFVIGSATDDVGVVVKHDLTVEEDAIIEQTLTLKGSFNWTSFLSITTTADSTNTAAEFNIFDEDNYGDFSYVNNSVPIGISFDSVTGNFTIDKTGVYTFTIDTIFDVSTTTQMLYIIREDGADIYNHGLGIHPSVDPAMVSLTQVRTIQAGSILTFHGDSTSANTLGANDGTTFSIWRIS